MLQLTRVNSSWPRIEGALLDHSPVARPSLSISIPPCTIVDRTKGREGSGVWLDSELRRLMKLRKGWNGIEAHES